MDGNIMKKIMEELVKINGMITNEKAARDESE